MAAKCKECKGVRSAEVIKRLNPTCGAYKCEVAHSDKVIAKKRKADDKAADVAFAKKKKEFKRNDIPNQHKLTQQAFNRMRVLEELKWFSDKGIEPYCISCLKTHMDWCCGHNKTVGAQGVLRYDPHNTKLQCNRYCNQGLSGNISGNKTTIGYKAGLAHRFGKDEAKWLADYLDMTTETKKWTADELEAIRFGAKKRIKELELE
ncbi:recombination protein NinG [bacterium]|nr:recombination protein NinG [bacterium]